MAIGMALRETIVLDDDGHGKTNSLAKYHLLNAVEMPKIKVALIEDWEPLGTYGAKRVGEMVAVAPVPASATAINHALNTTMTNYPFTPEKILEALIV